MGMVYRPYYLAKFLNKLGHECSIVTASFSHQRYRQPNTSGFLDQQTIDDVPFYFLKTNRYLGNGLARVISFFTFPLMLWLKAKALVRDNKPDVVILSAPTPLAVFSLLRLKKLSGAKFIFEIRDLWPLTLVELGGYSSNHPFIRLMQFCEDKALKTCDGCVSVLPLADTYLRQHGLSDDKFHYIPNGVPDTESEKRERGIDARMITAEIQQLKAGGKFIVGYAGAHGFANELDRLIEVAQLLGNQNVAFVLIGDGPEKKRLQETVRLKNLDQHVLFYDPIPKADIGCILQNFDTGFVGLKGSSLFKFGVSCNKLFDYMAAGIPIIQAIDAGNDLVAESGCGYSIKDGDVKQIKSSIEQLQSMPLEQRQQMGNQGLAFLQKHHLYSAISVSYNNVFKAISGIA